LRKETSADGGLLSEESSPLGFFFDEPQRMAPFYRAARERTQQFTLQWSKDKTDALRPLFQQQWNFSPSGSTSQIEDYQVELNLKLIIASILAILVAIIVVQNREPVATHVLFATVVLMPFCCLSPLPPGSPSESFLTLSLNTKEIR
jgi:hypothetical protein